jgi:biopolymer transport protein TolQ
MIVNKIFLSTNPFFEAYISSDVLGKLIFIGLFLLSICSWVIIIHKLWLTYRARKNARLLQQIFQEQRQNPLNLVVTEQQNHHPFLDLYLVLRKNAIEILNKNRLFGMAKSNLSKQEVSAYLSPSDIDIMQSHLSASIADAIKNLEKNLFLLSTVVSLGPFLGLLGTVWGILTTFSELQNQTGGSTNQMVIGGLSLALATTVLGLIDAIPALIGYNYLKNAIRDFETDMEGFSTEILTSVEMQYRKVDVE